MAAEGGVEATGDIQQAVVTQEETPAGGTAAGAGTAAAGGGDGGANSSDSGGAGDKGAGEGPASSGDAARGAAATDKAAQPQERQQQQEEDTKSRQEEEKAKQQRQEQQTQPRQDMASKADGAAANTKQAVGAAATSNSIKKSDDKATENATGTKKTAADKKNSKDPKKDEKKKWEKDKKTGKDVKKKDGEKGEGEESEEEEEKPFHFDGEHEYKGIIYPASVPIDILKRIKDFKFRPNDIVLAGYPKCGATWIEHATYLLLHADKGEPARNMSDLTAHCGFLEVRVPGGNVPPFIEAAETMEGPRLIRTHLPCELLQEQLDEAKCKVIVAVRNPKDCLVSYYHFLRNNEDIFGFFGDFEAFFEMVKEKRLTFGDWFDYVLGWWTAWQSSDQVIFLEFEDMVDDLRLQVQNIVDFLEIDVEDENIEEVTRLCYFKEMVKNPMTQLRIFPFLDADAKRYMRTGRVGDWKETLTDEQNEYLDGIFEQRVRGSGLEINFGGD